MSGPKLENAPLNVVHVAETGSTNADALGLALAGRATPFWVMADRQTAGKGRSGRAWVSLPGNLHASCAIKTRCDLRHAGQIALVAGVALAQAVRGLIGETGTDQPSDFRLKWPNDLMLGPAKCAGILVESSRDPQTGELIAVIGFGVNIVACATGLCRTTTHLGALGCNATPKVVLTALDQVLSGELARWDSGAGFPAVRARWLEFATPVGTPMSVHTGSVRHEGWFGGLDDDGALVLEMRYGVRKTISFGDVTLESAVTNKA